MINNDDPNNPFSSIFSLISKAAGDVLRNQQPQIEDKQVPKTYWDTLTAITGKPRKLTSVPFKDDPYTLGIYARSKDSINITPGQSTVAPTLDQEWYLNSQPNWYIITHELAHKKLGPYASHDISEVYARAFASAMNVLRVTSSMSREDAKDVYERAKKEPTFSNYGQEDGPFVAFAPLTTFAIDEILKEKPELFKDHPLLAKELPEEKLARMTKFSVSPTHKYVNK